MLHSEDYNAAHKIIMPHVAHTMARPLQALPPQLAIRITSVSRLAWRSSLSAAAAATLHVAAPQVSAQHNTTQQKTGQGERTQGGT